MQLEEVLDLGRTHAGEVRAVVSCYQTVHDLTTIPITDPARMQGFNSVYAERLWGALIEFHILTRQARERDVDSYWELQRRLPRIEKLVGLN